MFQFLRKPSPNLFSTKVRLILSIGIAVFVFLFLFVFQPFGVFDYLLIPNYVASLGYGGIALVLNLAFLFGWNEWLNRKFEQRWTMWRQLLSIFVHVTIIGLVNTIYGEFIFSEDCRLGMTLTETILRELFFAHSIAFMPIVFVITLAELKLSQHYSQQSESFFRSTNLNSEIHSVQIEFDTTESTISLSSDTFKFAKASGNYVELFYAEGDKIIKDLQRITLSKLGEQFANSSLNVMKSHRSYIVNLDAVENVQGNAQGYLLSLINTEDKVPVARNKVEEFNAVMNG